MLLRRLGTSVSVHCNHPLKRNSYKVVRSAQALFHGSSVNEGKTRLIRRRLLSNASFRFNSQEYSCLKVPPVMMKLDTPQFHALFTPELKELADIFSRHGYEIRIAGGAVRDLLMNKQPQDIDFASTATPAQMKEMFAKESVRTINEKGEKHGTITTRINDKENFEITTLRIDVVTDGRHAEVQFTTDWEIDAGRRDLTVNSLFLGLDGTVYDYFNGINDLEKRRIRFVGEPAARIQEDYLRILRYFRFYGRIVTDSNQHDEEILKAIEENASGLEKISGERIWVELKKILTGNFICPIIKTMLELRLGPYIGLPKKCNIQEFEQVCKSTESFHPHYMTLLVALLKNEQEALDLHNRLKLSAYERDLALFLTMHRQLKPSDDPLRPYQTLVIEAKSKPMDVYEWVKEVFKYQGNNKLLWEFEEWKVPKFPINGFMLKERGVKSGKLFTQILADLKRRWIDSGFSLSESKLLEHLDELIIELAPDKKQKKQNVS